MNIFNEHAPLKKRYVRANQAPFMNEKLSKEIMTRSCLNNKFLKTKTDANRKAYNKQRNYCVSLIRRERKSFFNNLDTKRIVNNKAFSVAYNHSRDSWGWLWFCCGVAHWGRGRLISVFFGGGGLLVGGGILVLAGGLGAGLLFYGVWILSWYFLIS